MGVKRRAWIYCRVSTAEQADGYSLDVQQQQCEAICTLNDWEVAGVYCDVGVSGSIAFRDRPQGAALWVVVASGDAIVTSKQDRLSRDTMDSLALLKDCRSASVGLVLGDQGTRDLADDAVAEFTFTIMAGQASFERARIQARIREAKALQRSRSEYLGGPVPFAYRKAFVDGVAVIAPDTELHRYVLDLHRRGYASRAIINHMRLNRGVSATPNTLCKFIREHTRA
ncbi:MAG: recombinase family protein [Hyphomicrobiaceae bacterium]|uniref:recombinase family protein n=1 Tax=Pseudorhodoplanes sp. TaxID=1934341 RepID=UPI003D0F6D99